MRITTARIGGSCDNLGCGDIIVKYKYNSTSQLKYLKTQMAMHIRMELRHKFYGTHIIQIESRLLIFKLLSRSKQVKRLLCQCLYEYKA